MEGENSLAFISAALETLTRTLAASAAAAAPKSSAGSSDACQ